MGRKHGLSTELFVSHSNDTVATTEEEHQALDVAQFEIEDIRSRFTRLCYSNEHVSFLVGHLVNALGETKTRVPQELTFLL